jgi:replication factor A1
MKVSDLKPNTAIDVLILDILSVGEPREFSTFKGSGRVCNADAKDETGKVKLSLWNEQIEQIAEGQKIKIENGWATEYKGSLQVSTGKRGTLTVM